MSGTGQDSYARIIQKNFQYLKRDLMHDKNTDDLINIATDCNAIDLSEADEIQKTHQTLKMSKLWKTVIRNGEGKCKLIISKLLEKEWVSINQLQEPKVVADGDLNFQKHPTRVTLEQQREKIILEMDLSRGVADKLFELYIITIDEHDEIDSIKNRIDKRKKLVDILLTKNDTDWIDSFMFTLHETDHDDLEKHLLNNANCTDDESIYRKYPPRTYAIHLEGQEHDSNWFTGVQQEQSVIDRTINQSVDGDVVEIREGSLVIYFRTTHPNLMSILKEKEQEFLQSILSSSETIQKYFRGKGIDKMRVEDVKVSGLRRPGKDCAGCYYTTVCNNYKSISDELEDDIMNDTLEKVKITANKYRVRLIEDILKINSRSKKANKFLEFLLGDSEAIIVFKDIFENKSLLKIEETICRCTYQPEKDSDMLIIRNNGSTSNHNGKQDQDNSCKACFNRPLSDVCSCRRQNMYAKDLHKTERHTWNV